MGDTRAIGQSVLGYFTEKAVSVIKDDHMPFPEFTVCLRSFQLDKLKYVQGKAFGYNKCKLSLIREEALTIKGMKERNTRDC
jgi:hypothetical protein